MTNTDALMAAIGSWTGTMRLRMMPTDNYTESAATALVSKTAGAYVTIPYTWSHDQVAQNGLLLIGRAMRHRGVQAVWADSWHAAPEWMNFAAADTDAHLLLQGSYPAMEGLDWGWNIRIEAGDDTLRIAMDNIVPGHDPYQVVEMELHRS